MGGETDLVRMLESLGVERRRGNVGYVTVDDVPDDITPLATIVESEGVTLIVPVEVAAERGWSVAFEATWLTLTVHSALEAVGLTAAVSGALAGAGIPANVLAGTFHDHLLIPVDQADSAIAAIESLRNPGTLGVTKSGR